MSSADSVKNRLYNKSKITGKTMQELLIMYCLERTLYRLSISKYADKFTLKGGVLLYALFDGNYARTTADVDLLAEKMSIVFACLICPGIPYFAMFIYLLIKLFEDKKKLND